MSDPSTPALLGGRPVRPEGPPPWPRPDLDVEAALSEALASGAWGQYHGGNVAALEEELASFHDVPYALTCGSGTLAVETALRALRVGVGNEVVMAAYDYEPNFLGVHAIGAKPVLADVAAHNWNLHAETFSAVIGPRTKAVLCSHLHGGIVPMREVAAIARERGIGVVEDASQAAGATVQGKPAGTWGDIGVLSFGGSKLLTAGRGGALLFSDAQLHQRARAWLHRGLQQWAPLSELQAAALRPQLRKLHQATLDRWHRVQELLAALSDVPGLSPFANAVEDSTQAFYKLGFQYDAAAFGLARDLFVNALRAEGVAFDPGFKALHIGRSPSRFEVRTPLSNAEAAHAHCVGIHHPLLGLGTEDVLQAAEAIGKVHRAACAGMWKEERMKDEG